MFKRISNNTATLEECERPFIAIIIEMSQSILSMKHKNYKICVCLFVLR